MNTAPISYPLEPEEDEGVVCPKCGSHNSASALTCTYCHRNLHSTAPDKIAVLKGFLLAVLLVFLVAIVGWQFFGRGLVGASSATNSTGMIPTPGGAASTQSGSGPDIAALLSGLNTNPPSYVKQVTAYKEGTRAFVVYFTLADSTGAMTAADGQVTLTISEVNHDYVNNTQTESLLFTESVQVKASDFQETEIGLGALKHDAILASFGRITYTSFARMPSQLTGKAKILFTTKSGELLEGEETILFDQ